MPDNKPTAHHARDDDHSRHHSRPSGIDKFLEAEFKSKREEQHHDAYLGPEVDVGFGSYRRQILEMRLARKPATI